MFKKIYNDFPFLFAASVYNFSIEVSVIYSSSFLGLCPKSRVLLYE
jgi:hypothetical protein